MNAKLVFVGNFQLSQNSSIINIMGKQFKKKTTIRYGNKTMTSEVAVFGGDSHIDYSGFGYHESDKDKAANRRNRKQEERRARMGTWE